MESPSRRASFWRVLRVLAATAIVLVGGRLAAPVLNPVFFAVVLSLLFGPIYAWLLGGPGAFLALPMTLFVAVMLDTFPETRWLANVVGVSSPPKSGPSPCSPGPCLRRLPRS